MKHKALLRYRTHKICRVVNGTIVHFDNAFSYAFLVASVPRPEDSRFLMAFTAFVICERGC